MLKAKRQKLITQRLEKDGILNVAELSIFFQCSEETIRRDLKELEKSSNLTRTYGGAYLKNADKNVPFSTRENLYKAEKIAMAKKAVSLINKDSTIMLDSSSTCLNIAQAILSEEAKPTILTNSLSICNLYAGSAFDNLILCTGGTYHSISNSFSGYRAVEFINQYYTDIAFISCSKIDMNFGLSDDDANEAEIRKAMLTHTKQKVLVVDHTKFIDVADNLFFSLSDIDIIITDKPLDSEWIKYLTEHHIQIL